MTFKVLSIIWLFFFAFLATEWRFGKLFSRKWVTIYAVILTLGWIISAVIHLSIFPVVIILLALGSFFIVGKQRRSDY